MYRGGEGGGRRKEFVQMELMDVDTTKSAAPIISNIEDIEIWPLLRGPILCPQKLKSVTTCTTLTLLVVLLVILRICTTIERV